MLSVQDITARLGYSKPDVVYHLIASGQLAAYRVASRRGGKPRWRIDEADFDAYLASIRNHFPTPKQKIPAIRVTGSKNAARLRRELLKQ